MFILTCACTYYSIGPGGDVMHKTERLVLLIEPEILKELKKLAKEASQAVSQVVRASIVNYLKSARALKHGRALSKLERYQMPLAGIEKPHKMLKLIERGYRHV